MFLPIEVMIWVIPLLILQVSLIILCLINILKNNSISKGSKIGWILIVILITLLGTILYYSLAWKKKNSNFIPNKGD